MRYGTYLGGASKIREKQPRQTVGAVLSVLRHTPTSRPAAVRGAPQHGHPPRSMQVRLTALAQFCVACTVGEVNNSGDVVETALTLCRATGFPELYEDVERIVRGHMLPSQLRDTSWIPASDGATDGTTDVAERHVGAWGFPAPV